MIPRWPDSGVYRGTRTRPEGSRGIMRGSGIIVSGFREFALGIVKWRWRVARNPTAFGNISVTPRSRLVASQIEDCRVCNRRRVRVHIWGINYACPEVSGNERSRKAREKWRNPRTRVGRIEIREQRARTYASTFAQSACRRRVDASRLTEISVNEARIIASTTCLDATVATYPLKRFTAPRRGF